MIANIKYPFNALPSNLLPCPPIGRPSLKLTQRFWFFVHEYVLLPISIWYTDYYNISSEPAVHPLPFGLVLKRHERVREQEGLAMNLACAMGIPAPRFISYGSLDSKDHYPSILMTRLSGRPLDTFKSDEINLDGIKRELIRILTRMRSFASPWDEAVCGVAGGPICGPLIPACPLPACVNEEAFQQSIREITSWDRRRGEEAEYVRQGEEFFALPRHAIVFTHGDLNNHNIMIGQDGRISGIVDWEAAAWLPDYWEVSVTAILSRRPWGRFLNEQVTSGVYQKEVEGHRAIFPLIADSLSY